MQGSVCLYKVAHTQNQSFLAVPSPECTALMPAIDIHPPSLCMCSLQPWAEAHRTLKEKNSSFLYYVTAISSSDLPGQVHILWSPSPNFLDNPIPLPYNVLPVFGSSGSSAAHSCPLGSPSSFFLSQVVSYMSLTSRSTLFPHHCSQHPLHISPLLPSFCPAKEFCLQFGNIPFLSNNTVQSFLGQLRFKDTL